ncbi:hypothetical protein Gogos_004581, partial [Gossypium gossypioides]|nr:hypothetical protein [Gossypium gossypioides]
ESNGEGDLEKVESSWESDVGEVQADGEGVSATSIEVDKDIGMESGGHISLGSTDGENNDSEVTADEYAGDFVTSDRLDNVVASRSGEEEDGNDTEKTGCRPLIRLDGCFLKGSFKNEFLTAVGIHANNQMFPIAWVVVEVECTDSWAWFLSLLSTDLGLEYKFGYTIISDQQKIVKCTTERVWEDLCSTLEKKNKDAYDNLMKKSPKMWTRAFLWTTCKTNIVDNNLCEAFNSIIVEARFKSIIRMLEDIRTKMMTRIVQKRKLCNRWKQNYGPLVKAKFDANK